MIIDNQKVLKKYTVKKKVGYETYQSRQATNCRPLSHYAAPAWEQTHNAYNTYLSSSGLWSSDFSWRRQIYRSSQNQTFDQP